MHKKYRHKIAGAPVDFTKPSQTRLEKNIREDWHKYREDRVRPMDTLEALRHHTMNVCQYNPNAAQNGGEPVGEIYDTDDEN